MAKLQTESLQVKHMNNKDYMLLHKRMYALTSSGSYKLCLVNSKDIEVSIEVCEDIFRSFTNYEVSFGIMLMLYTSLCVKFGQIQIPF